METVDEEVTAGALDFMDRAAKAGKPFFLWWNSTRMHIWTHLKPDSKGKTGLGVYPDGMVEHDGHIGQILDKLEELGLADNTIVMYSSGQWCRVLLAGRTAAPPRSATRRTRTGRAATACPA